jgi:hypothetical protein
MRHWPWRRIFFFLAIFLIGVGIAPLAALLWHGWTHNFQPLSMQLPTAKGEYASAEFKTDLDEGYMIQLELMDESHRSIELNPDATIDLDWKIVDTNGAVIAKGVQDGRIGGGNEVNFGEYKPRRGTHQRMIVNIHEDIAEPAGSTLTLQVNSEEDPEGAAFGFLIFSWWAAIVGGAGAVTLIALFLLRIARPIRSTPSRIPQTP